MEFTEEEIEVWENSTLGADPDFVLVGSEEDHKQLNKLKEEIKMSNSLFDFNMNVGTGEFKVVNSNTGEVINGEGHIGQLIYTKENLFRRLVNLEEQMETLKDDIKAAKEDFTFSDDNPQGLDKEVVKEIAAFAKKYVAEKVDAVIEQAAVFEALKEELVG